MYFARITWRWVIRPFHKKAIYKNWTDRGISNDSFQIWKLLHTIIQHEICFHLLDLSAFYLLYFGCEVTTTKAMLRLSHALPGHARSRQSWPSWSWTGGPARSWAWHAVHTANTAAAWSVASSCITCSTGVVWDKEIIFAFVSLQVTYQILEPASKRRIEILIISRSVEGKHVGMFLLVE